MWKKLRWPAWLGLALCVAAVVVTLATGLRHLAWAERLSAEGSPPPSLDSQSPTGYRDGQRYLLGTYERGETYRWIAVTQQCLAEGPGAIATYRADAIPEGRPQLLPRAYLAWLAMIATGVRLCTGRPIGLCVEAAAFWEPVVTQLLALAGVIVFVARRWGALTAGSLTLGLALFPPFALQFLPGALTPRTPALLLAAYVLALQLDGREARSGGSAFRLPATLATAFALWLDPAIGFWTVVISAVGGVATSSRGTAPLPYLRWSIIGAALTVVAWLLDRAPWDIRAGELRYVHPLYALAWLGLGLGLDGWQRWRITATPSLRHAAEMAAGLLLLLPLVAAQLTHGYRGWLYAAAAMRRLHSMDETQMFAHAGAWLAQASLAEALLIAPVLAALASLGAALWPRARATPAAASSAPLRSGGVVLLGVLALAFFQVRWGVVASLVALVWVARGAARSLQGPRQVWISLAVTYVGGLLLIGATLPRSWRRPAPGDAPRPVDMAALIHRDFAHWLAIHHSGRRVAALASPELSDSLVFHGGLRALMSTAWESFPGQVAASRILSAPEASEAEAVIETRGITHLILASWDSVLPLLVKPPDTPEKDTLHARLQRWVLPSYLRPIPYQLPAISGYEAEKLAVFAVTPHQDEGLALSRLAEYFVEMGRDEPASLAAQALGEAYPEHPDAAMARALVQMHAKRPVESERELARVVADARAGRAPSSWDRRVQRAIVLALGRRPELARRELAACLAEAQPDALTALTPLQAYRVTVLTRTFDLAFPDAALSAQTAALGQDYEQGRSRGSTSPYGSGRDARK